MEQEVADAVIPENKKEANEPESHSSEAIAELKSSDGAEDNSNVGVSEKKQGAVKSEVSSKTETAKRK